MNALSSRRPSAGRLHPLLLPLLILLLASSLRLWHLSTLPPGFSAAELASLHITEREQGGDIVVFAQPAANPVEADPGVAGQQAAAPATTGQEALFHLLQAITASVMGSGLITLRLPAVFSGLLTVALLYALGRRLYGTRPALIASALLAVGLWPVLLDRLALRETLVPVFTVGALLLFVNALHIRRDVSPDTPLTATYASLGVLVAASLYEHWFGLFIALMITLSTAYLFLTRQPISRRAAGTAVFAIIISTIVVVPYIVTTLRMPEASGLAALSAAMQPDNVLQAVISGLGTIIGRGDLSPVFNVPGRPLLDPVSAVLALYGLWLSLSQWRKPASFIPALAALVGLIPLLLSTIPGSFLALVGALPLLYLLVGRAIDDLLDELAAFRPAWMRVARWLPLLLIGFNLVWTGADLFGHWGLRPDVLSAYNAERGLLAAHLDATATEIPTVVCSPRLIDTDVHRGDPHLLDLMMQREDAPLRFVDCANALLIAEGGDPQQFAFTDRSIYERMYPFLQSWIDFRPPVLVQGLDERSVLELNMRQLLGNTVGRLLTTSPTGWAPESPGGAASAVLPVRFGGNLTFLGYVPERVSIYAPGDVVPVITYWRVDGPVPSDVRIFVHVLSDPAAIAAQNQAINVMPGTLRARDVFIQVNYVVLPESIPAGTYDISIGIFQAESELRLPVFDGERVRGDRLFLHEITVESAPTDPDHNSDTDTGGA